MLKKLVVFAITSGLAAKAYQKWRAHNIAAGLIPSHPPAKTSAAKSA